MRWRHLGFLWLLALAAVAGRAAEVIPPAPSGYCDDQAGLLQPGTVADLDRTLDGFERETSNQIVVAIFPKMQSDSSIEDYTVRVAEAWGIGQKGKSNGAVLFIFTDEHKMYIEVGYGLEATLTDALSHRIVTEVIAPRFQRQDFDGGVTAGVQAMIAATRGEYRGNGSTAGDSATSSQTIFVLIFLALVIVSSLLRSRRHAVYGSGGWGGGWSGGPWIFPGGGFGGGGGGGGFSGGGGGFGGGGAGGSW